MQHIQQDGVWAGSLEIVALADDYVVMAASASIAASANHLTGSNSIVHCDLVVTKNATPCLNTFCWSPSKSRVPTSREVEHVFIKRKPEMMPTADSLKQVVSWQCPTCPTTVTLLRHAGQRLPRLVTAHLSSLRRRHLKHWQGCSRDSTGNALFANMVLRSRRTSFAVTQPPLLVENASETSTVRARMFSKR